MFLFEASTGGAFMPSTFPALCVRQQKCAYSSTSLQAHLVWGLGCFIDSDAALDEPLQVLLDGQNTRDTAALFHSLQTRTQGCCHTTHILPGMQTEAWSCW